jgi:hypothetical protein
LIFSGMSGKAISLGVVNADRGAIGQEFIRQVLGPVGRNGLIVVHSEPTAARARELAANGTLNAVIVIPAGFSARVAANQPASMRIIANANSPVSAQIARSVAQGYTADLYRTRLSAGTVLHGPGEPAEPARAQLRALAGRAAAATPPVVFRDVSTATKQLDQKSFFAQVERGNLAAGLVIPPGYDTTVRAGHRVAIRYMARPDQSSEQLGETVRGAVSEQAATLGAARFTVAEHSAPTFDAALAPAARIAPTVPPISVTQTTAGTTAFSKTLVGQPVSGAGPAAGVRRSFH